MSDDTTHYLVVTLNDGEKDWEVEHPSSCPRERISSFLGDARDDWREEFTCHVGRMLADGGADAIAGGIPEPGHYPLSFESSYQPSTVYGPAEWDAWLEIGDAL
jgi:hypothetical protein